MKIFNFIVLICLVCGIVVISSCKEENPRGIVNVVDETGAVVSGAIVKIYVPTPGDANIEDENEREIYMTTDGSGKVERDFKYEAIYNVYVYTLDDDDDTLKTGTGVLRLEFDVVTTENVTIRP